MLFVTIIPIYQFGAHSQRTIWPYHFLFFFLLDFASFKQTPFFFYVVQITIKSWSLLLILIFS